MTAVEHDAAPLRRIRPWIAALLTLFGWGVGLYYARQTKTALKMAFASVLAAVLLTAGLLAYSLSTNTSLSVLADPQNRTVSLLQLAVSAIVAIWVWRVATRQQHVARSGPVRLLGYVGIWLLPILLSIVAATLIRFTLFQPFRSPSGSMQPALHVGDYFAVTKWSYGYSRFSVAPFEQIFPAGRLFGRSPVRGDIVVFRPASEPNRDFVKRIVGMPGDRVQMIGGVLYINGQSVRREDLGQTTIDTEDGPEQAQLYRETLPNGVTYSILDRRQGKFDDTQVFVVPANQYFVIGDDRDNSADSRSPSMVGFVRYDHLVGRVDYITPAPEAEH